jgi:hypothetical protein
MTPKLRRASITRKAMTMFSEFFRSIKPQPKDAFAAISLALFWMAIFTLAERIIQ